MKDYKKILEGVVNIVNNIEKSDIGFANICAFIGENCPELKKPEDEIIRKKLLKMFNDMERDESILDDYGLDKLKTITWLEKEGKQKYVNFDEAEKEKSDFVGDDFIKCYANFQDFKEGETYWLEYMGNDNYNVRSDNLLGKTYHITPCQLYTIFKKTNLDRKAK